MNVQGKQLMTQRQMAVIARGLREFAETARGNLDYNSAVKFYEAEALIHGAAGAINLQQHVQLIADRLRSAI